MESTKEHLKAPSIYGRSSLSRWPWWTAVILAIGLVVLYLILATQNYHETFLYLTQGIITTLRITLLSYILATVLGLVAGLARVSKNIFMFNLSTLYVEVVRGVPLVVLILYVAFGLIPLFVEVVRNLGISGLATSPDSSFFQGLAHFTIRIIPMEIRAVFALGFAYGAFEAEVFRAGIQSIGKGQLEAARSLGMTYVQAMRFIILPQAIRRVLPPLGNDFIACLKDSSLVTVLAVNELTQLGRLRRASTFRFLETFNVVAFLYLSMTLVLSTAVRGLEKRLKIEE
jgi:polar amino acid transport system permease protein